MKIWVTCEVKAGQHSLFEHQFRICQFFISDSLKQDHYSSKTFLRFCIYSKAENHDGVIDGLCTRIREKRLIHTGPVETCWRPLSAVKQTEASNSWWGVCCDASASVLRSILAQNKTNVLRKNNQSRTNQMKNVAAGLMSDCGLWLNDSIFHTRGHNTGCPSMGRSVQMLLEIIMSQAVYQDGKQTNLKSLQKSDTSTDTKSDFCNFSFQFTLLTCSCVFLISVLLLFIA